MESLNYIGQKVIKKSGEIFSVIFADKYLIVLDDGKKGYDIRLSIPKGVVRFEDNEFQKKVEAKLRNIANEELNHLSLESNQVLPNKMLDKYRDIIKEAVILFKGEGNKRNISYSHTNDYGILRAGQIYGTRALDIYKTCCKELGFDWSQRGRFNLQQLLFAEHATPENFAVWMLPNNSYTGKISGCWANVIKGDKIYEVRNIDDEGNSDDRVVFAKQGNGEYVFMGVYRLETSQRLNEFVDGVKITYLKIYNNISKEYPM